MGTKVTRQDRNPKLHLTCMKYYLEQHLAREDKTEKNIQVKFTQTFSNALTG